MCVHMGGGGGGGGDRAGGGSYDRSLDLSSSSMMSKMNDFSSEKSHMQILGSTTAAGTAYPTGVPGVGRGRGRGAGAGDDVSTSVDDGILLVVACDVIGNIVVTDVATTATLHVVEARAAVARACSRRPSGD